MQFPPGSFSFAIRTTVALLLAYYLGFWLQLDSTSSAGVCVAIVAQPIQGAILSKALYRVAGTFIGASVGVIAIACFVQDRVLLLTFYALWLAACTFVSSRLKDFGAYGAALAGYTVAIIAISNIDTPNEAMLTALNRAAAILLGIACVALVNLPFNKSSAWKPLVERLQTLLRDATDRSLALLTSDQPRPDALTIADQAAAILAVRSQIGYVAREPEHGRSRAHGARGATAGLLGMLHAGNAIARHIAAGGVGAEDRGLLEQAVAMLRPPQANCPGSMRTAGVEGITERGHLADLLDDLMLQRSLVVDGIESLVSGREPIRQAALHAYQDIPSAALNALRAAVTVTIGALFCIYSGWSPSTQILTDMSAPVVLLSAMADPSRAGRIQGLMAPFGMLLAAISKFGLMTQAPGASFAIFALSVAPCALLICLLGRHPKTTGLSIGLLVAYTIVLTPTNVQTFDLTSFLNTALCFAGATLAAAGTFSILQPISSARRLRSLLIDEVKDLNRTLCGGHAAETTVDLSLHYDRLVLASTCLRRKTKARLALLSHLDDLGMINISIRRARAGLDELLAHDPESVDQATRAGLALLGRGPDDVHAASRGLVEAAEARPQASQLIIRAASRLDQVAALFKGERRLLRQFGLGAGA